MNQQDAKAEQLQTETVEDLELTNEQAEQTQAGSASPETYYHLTMKHVFITSMGK